MAYTFEKSVTVNLKTDIQYDLPEGGIQITDMKISVMGVKLYGRWADVSSHKGVAPYRPELKALMKDGKEIKLECLGASIAGSSGRFFNFEYVLPNTDGEGRGFIDQEFLDQLEGIWGDDSLIPLE